MKRVILAAAAGITAVGAVSASAATLGDISGGNLGVASEIVASCDNDGITVNYTVDYVPAAPVGTYNVADVLLSDVNALCAGQSYSITLADDSGIVLGVVADDSLSVVGGEATIDFTGESVNGELVEGIAIAISD
jgi:hypothetical protein